MSDITIPFGTTTLNAHVPDTLIVTHIVPRNIRAADDPQQHVAQALDQPLGGATLDALQAGQRVAIAINDKTRPVPHADLLPPLLQRLEQRGVAPDDIQLVIATGLHPPMTPDEFPTILPPEIIARYPVVSHDATDKANLVQLGQTPQGTPVWVNRAYMAADWRLVVGNIEPHQFMGFSGGVKSAAIGLAGAATINHNHAMMTQPGAALGQYADNPARADVEAIGQMIGVHFALNAILNGDKALVEALAGTPQTVLAAGIPLARRIYEVPVAAPVDVMIAAPGGHPKDINLYQAQKGLAHAVRVTKPGGTVILAAACPEGSGSDSYENWVLAGDSASHVAVLERFAQEGFKVGPHKAYQLSRDGSQVRVLFVTEMDHDLARRLLLHPVPSLAQAIEIATRDLPPGAQVGVMPVANATIPTLKD